jgi:hypothetical protein
MSQRKCKELDKAIATLKRLLASEGAKLVHEGQLRKALRELSNIRRGGGGNRERRRLVRVVALISRIVCEEFLKNDKPSGR